MTGEPLGAVTLALGIYEAMDDEGSVGSLLMGKSSDVGGADAVEDIG
jgi:hypothetical protein